MSEIGIQEAVKMAQMMKNHYRVFEKLEEVLTIVAQADALVKEAEAARDKVKADHDSYVKKIADAMRQSEELDANVRKAKDNSNESIKVYKEQVESEKKWASEEIGRIRESIIEERAKHTALLAELKAEGDGYARKAIEAEKQYKAVKDKIASLVKE